MQPPDPAAVAVERLRRLGGDTLVRQMIELYLSHGRDRIDALRDAVSASDAPRVERAAHTLKTSAGNLGVLALQRSAEAVEMLARQGVIDHALAARLLAEYDASVSELRRVAAELDVS